MTGVDENENALPAVDGAGVVKVDGAGLGWPNRDVDLGGVVDGAGVLNTVFFPHVT